MAALVVKYGPPEKFTSSNKGQSLNGLNPIEVTVEDKFTSVSNALLQNA